MLKHHTVRLQKVPIFPNRDSAPSATPAPAPPPSPWPHRRLPVSLDVTPPGTSCEEDHAGFVLLCLVYVTKRSVPKVHPHPRPVSVSFLLRPGTIPLGAGQGARGLLPPLAVVNTGVQTSLSSNFPFSFFFLHCLEDPSRSGIAECVLFLVCQGPCILLSTVATPSCVPTGHAPGSGRSPPVPTRTRLLRELPTCWAWVARCGLS